jgi:hypothetical protein
VSVFSRSSDTCVSSAVDTRVIPVAPHARRVGVLLAQQLAAPLIAVAVIGVAFLPLSHTYDLAVFLRAGHTLLHGGNVYPRPGTAAVYSGASFVYPYFAAWPFVALAAVSSGFGGTVFLIASACAVLAACFVGPKRGPWPATLILCTTFTITGLQLGALSPLLFAGTVFLWHLRDRPLAFGLLAGPVLASKLFLAPLLVWLLLARRYRACAYASASIVALLILSFALGPIGPLQYVQVLNQLGAHEARSGFGVIGALMNVGFAPAAAQASAAILTLGVFAAAYVHHRRTGNERVSFCVGIIACLILTPVLWSHYLILLPAGLIALGARRRWLVILALASWAIAPPHGVRLNTAIIAGITSSGVWLLVGAVSLVAVASSTLRAGGHSARQREISRQH